MGLILGLQLTTLNIRHREAKIMHSFKQFRKTEGRWILIEHVEFLFLDSPIIYCRRK